MEGRGGRVSRGHGVKEADIGLLLSHQALIGLALPRQPVVKRIDKRAGEDGGVADSDRAAGVSTLVIGGQSLVLRGKRLAIHLIIAAHE